MSKDWTQVEKELKEPFPSKEIEWRVGATNKEKTKGIALAYITNSVIQARLDKVFGISNWKNDFKEWKGKGVLCGLSFRLEEGSEWLTKWDGADESDVEATKGGLSDSMKRAAYQWGIGRYLKMLNVTWVDIEPFGKGYVIKKGCEPKLPKWALPEEEQTRNTERQTGANGQSQKTDQHHGQSTREQGNTQSKQDQKKERGQSGSSNGHGKGKFQSDHSTDKPLKDQMSNSESAGNGGLDIFPFTGLVKLIKEPFVEKKPTPEGLMDKVSIQAITKDGEKALIEGWGVEMIEPLADLSVDQILSIKEAKAGTTSSGMIRIRLELGKFDVCTPTAA